MPARKRPPAAGVITVPERLPKRGPDRDRLRQRLEAALARLDQADRQAKAGPPPIRVDEDVLRGLASLQCTYDEMAGVLGVSADTLERRYREVVEAARATGRTTLRRLQWRGAQEGNPAMLIWLGKQMLGQVERRDITSAGEALRPAVIALPEESWGQG